jgi:hypothetical protein
MGPDPFDQADGFHGDGADDTGEWYETLGRGSVNTTWNFLYELQKSADRKDWSGVRRQIADFRGDIPFHDFSLKVLRSAAGAGHLDIVQALFSRNFRLAAEDGEEALEELARHHPASRPVIAFLIENAHADPGRALSAIAAEGAPEMMEIFRNAGCDILRSGRAMSHALHNGNIGMMKYLHAHGADLYSPLHVAALYGGIERYQTGKPGPVAPAGAAHIRQAFRAMIDDDARQWLYYYAINVPPHPSLDDFRAVTPGVAGRNMTLMQIAARAGCFADVAEAAAKETKNPLNADDMLRSDTSGASVLAVLAARLEAGQAFDVRLWFRKPEEAAKLHDGLKQLGADMALDPAVYAADLQRYRLKALSKTARISLKPRPPGPQRDL